MSDLGTTNPSEMVGWYSAPNLRGTLDLVWGCAFTIFVSTWTANHINVPPYGSPATWRFRYKFKIMMLSLLAPEYVAAIAATELRTSVALTKRMRQLGFDQWTTKHSFFVMMGGYMIEYDNRWVPLDTDTFVQLLEAGTLEVKLPRPVDNKKALKKTTKKAVGVQEKPLNPAKVTSNSDQVILPWISRVDMDDRSKADYMLKAVACVQLTWLLVQCVGRAIQGLALSTLEATTIAYVSCALSAYAAWWRKPYDLQSPIIVSVPPDHPITDHLQDLSTYIPFDKEPKLEVDQRTYVVYVLGTFTIFGAYSGLHLLAWNLHFGSDLEQQLWRWLTISLLAVHVILVTAALFMHTRASTIQAKEACIATWLWLVDRAVKPITPNAVRPFFRSLGLLDHLDEAKVPPWPSRLPILLLTTQYTLTSAYLLVESFVGLRQMPFLLYMTVNWMQFLPHIH